MLVIPMWQPHASAVSLGLKKIETRGQSIKYRGWVAIHAAKKWDREIRKIIQSLPDVALDAFISKLGLTRGYPLGKIIAVGKLIDCCPTVDLIQNPAFPSVFREYPDLDTTLERALGNYESGRWGWVLSNVRALRVPLPYKAHQGCYQLEPEVEGEVRNRELA